MPTGDALEMPWLRAQLVEWLHTVADNRSPLPERMEDEFFDFLDVTGIVDCPDEALRLILKNRDEVEALQNFGRRIEAYINSPEDSARAERWSSAAESALITLAALEPSRA